MARIAVVTSAPPLSEGGHLVLARSLARLHGGSEPLWRRKRGQAAEDEQGSGQERP